MSRQDFCVTVNLGRFDRIELEGADIRGCRTYIALTQKFYDRPLEIKLPEDIRQLSVLFRTVEICCGCSVIDPKSGKH